MVGSRKLRAMPNVRGKSNKLLSCAVPDLIPELVYVWNANAALDGFNPNPIKLEIIKVN